jgi:hypothetical protein
MDLFLSQRLQLRQVHSVDQRPMQTRLHFLERMLAGSVCRGSERAGVIVAD